MGLAVTKLPDATLSPHPAMGEFAKPIDNSASISTRTKPAASFTHCKARVIGNAQVLMEEGRGVELIKALVYLRAYAVNQNQAYSKLLSKAKSWT